MSRLVVIALLLAQTSARADDSAVATAPAPEARPPLAVPPWLLARDAVRLDTTAEIELSSDRVAKPFAIAPDVWFGAADGLTVGVTESRYAASGFRGSAGNSFCVSGTSGGCQKVYN